PDAADPLVRRPDPSVGRRNTTLRLGSGEEPIRGEDRQRGQCAGLHLLLVTGIVLHPRAVDFRRPALGFLRRQPLAGVIQLVLALVLLRQRVYVARLAVLDVDTRRLSLLLNLQIGRGDRSQRDPSAPDQKDDGDTESPLAHSLLPFERLRDASEARRSS